MKILFTLFLFTLALYAEDTQTVEATASVAIVNMKAEEAQSIALRRARSYAIEIANGVEISSSTIVKDGKLELDFIKTYSNGIIIKESITWLPITSYQLNSSQAPIPEYHIKIVADVKLIEKETDLTLNVKLNQEIYRSGEHLHLSLKSSADANIAIFFLGENDRMYKLLPYPNDTLSVKANTLIVYPKKDSENMLTMQALKNHKKTTEALWILSTKTNTNINFEKYFPKEEYTLTEFSNIYAKISSRCVENILPYIILQ